MRMGMGRDGADLIERLSEGEEYLDQVHRRTYLGLCSCAGTNKVTSGWNLGGRGRLGRW